MICEIYLRKISKQLKRSNYLSINTYGIMEIEDKYQEYVDLAYAFFTKNEPKMVNALLHYIKARMNVLGLL